ncbi:MAG: threonylcarbamoyl-AMP synthase [Clostridiales bacterium]|nr:threonylcarbamoyl-AMP synthase [Clostridiales bacterium]
METLFCGTDENNLRKSDKVFKRAAEIIKRGGLVAFPTETVYGLGANALNSRAVKKIYEAKGRPSDNPLIVHIASLPELKGIAEEVSPKAEKLIDAFWPGPLTIIFKKKSIIPDETSGGLDTVAVRFPENAAARYFIRACGVPIAAPSANTSGKPSPTSAKHVLNDLNGKIDMIIDGGEAEFGLESTIVSAVGEKITLLRPGSVTVDMLKEVVGEINIDKTILTKPDENLRPLAPGMKYKHYSPLCNITIVKGEREKAVKYMAELGEKSKAEGEKAGIITTEEDRAFFENRGLTLLDLGRESDPETIAARLFKVLRTCDDLHLSCAFIKAFPEKGIGLAIMNRLKKAAGYNITEAR